VIKPQLLAPAGDFASVDAALDHGADALYVGIGPFNLRAHAPNFTFSDLEELRDRVHGKRRLLYYAFNTMPHSKTLEQMALVLNRLKSENTLPDALIVSDPGVILLCKEIVPEIPLHLSTQTGTFNRRSLQFWKNAGIKRVVLPRELNLTEIEELASAHLLETEVFIHGAMCVSISGRCLMGAYLQERHPNRGDCPQPCRWKYRISPDASDNSPLPEALYLDAEEHEKGTYFLNSRDLCTLSLLPEIICTGVSSLKIEGRNKSAHYVASVVKAYRSALDSITDFSGSYRPDTALQALLDSVDHRPYTTGFYNNALSLQEVFTSKAASATRIIGVVKALLPGGFPVVDVKNRFEIGGNIELLPVNQSKTPCTVNFTKITDLAGNELKRPPSNRLIVAHCLERLQIGDMLRSSPR
jgi:U32 family peptidase